MNDRCLVGVCVLWQETRKLAHWGHHCAGVESDVYSCGLQVLGLVAACVLMRTRRTAENFIYRDLADTEGMHIWCAAASLRRRDSGPVAPCSVSVDRRLTDPVFQHCLCWPTCLMTCRCTPVASRRVHNGVQCARTWACYSRPCLFFGRI